MKNIFIYLSFIFVVVVIYGFVFSIGSQTTNDDGKTIFVDQKCISCHSVKSVELILRKKDATDLSTIGKTRNEEFLKKYLSKEIKIDDKPHKFTFKGTEEQLKILSNWLASLKVSKPEKPTKVD